MRKGNGDAGGPAAAGPQGAKANGMESVDRARAQLAKLLRARIADRERELCALRAELNAIGGQRTVRKTQKCSACGKAGHTKRTCREQSPSQGA